MANLIEMGNGRISGKSLILKKAVALRNQHQLMDAERANISLYSEQPRLDILNLTFFSSYFFYTFTSDTTFRKEICKELR